jgi:4,4'-diaponeurosporenoate glycosyltransferase
MALAQSLKKANIPFRVFVGDGDVSFRMYPGGISQLNQGFTKNLATCAAKTHVRVFLLVALFIASITSPVLHLACSLAGAQPLLLLYGAFYAFWVVVLFFISGRIGRFHPLAVLLYPLPLIMFFAVFVQSFAIRLFRGRVKWKGRAIELER